MKKYLLYFLCFIFFSSFGISCKSAYDKQRPVGQTWIPKNKKSKKKMRKINSRRRRN